MIELEKPAAFRLELTPAAYAGLSLPPERVGRINPRTKMVLQENAVIEGTIEELRWPGPGAGTKKGSIPPGPP